jgi:hypothetical protein
MTRVLTLLAFVVIAIGYLGTRVSAQAAPEVTLTRFDCGTSTAS